ncbi:xanthine dehydrogenase family protein molybdopterin-binding subunit [Enterovirga sp.]|uniref:xanthine dehydrogenase family protein molybdopterin-binding subunit n=1 Tax=Enterovirga sp. TaxID=2026350 RepID=UPI00262C65C4|nr:xanthine dehydrogenase family protein molybdopterin-binding subunit [Enterovirga sp.]MDB5591527.1 xanthine dehydrogenase [Enterovirga sp.]
MSGPLNVIGRSPQQVDALEKVLGRATFAADISLPRMLHGAVARSPLAHATIRNIDLSAALRVKGVRAVVCGRDVPYRYNLPLRDQPFLAIDRVRYVGEPVAAVAAEDLDAAREAASLIRVEYEELPAVLDPAQAMLSGAPLLHPEFNKYWRDEKLFDPIPNSNVLSHFKLRKGDVEAGFAEADEIFEGTYTSQAFNHGAIEPHAVVAQVELAGQMTLWSCQQSPWFAADDLAIALGWPVHRIRVVTPFIGGGFGAKHGLKAEPPAVALALKTGGRPVKLVMSREEVFTALGVRGAVTVKLRTGVKRDGRLVARTAEVIWDTGAYADVGPLLCRNGSYSSTGPYRIPNQSIDGYCVYTNKVVTSAFRSYGTMEMSFAYESHMDEIARGLQMDPVQIRRQNLLQDGDETATGETPKAVGLVPTLTACASAMEWDKPKAPGRGRAIVSTAKSSVAPSGSSSFIQMNDDGTLNVMCSTTEMGQGSRTVMTQLAAEAAGARFEDVHLIASDTAVTPPDRSTSSSRSTFNMGNAIVRAAGDAREQILDKASELLEEPRENLDVRDSAVFVRKDSNRFCSFAQLAGVRPGSNFGPIVGRGSFVPADTTAFNVKTGEGRRITAFWLYSCQGVELEVDPDTGKITLHRVVSAHDTGRTLNPVACEGQIEGGAAIGCSTALFEDLVLDRDGKVLNPNFLDYRMATSCDIPPIESILIEVPHPEGPYGAKGIGEGPTTGIAAAIANAVEDAIGVRITDLPITPEKILRALGKLPPATP